MHTNERNITDMHQLECCLRIVIQVTIKDEIASQLLNAQTLIVTDINTILVVYTDTSHVRCHAVIAKSKSHQGNTVTHSVLEDEFRIKSQDEPITSLKG